MPDLRAITVGDLIQTIGNDMKIIKGVEKKTPAKRGGRASRQKGDRIERELVGLHRGAGVHAERVPLSGATRYQGNGADLDLYIFGKDAPPLIAECKARKNGAGFATLEKWLGDNDLLFLRRAHSFPLVVLPWETWVTLIALVPR